MILYSKKDCHLLVYYCYIFNIAVDWAHPVKQPFIRPFRSLSYSNRVKEVKCGKWCPRSSRITACRESQNKTHQETGLWV